MLIHSCEKLSYPFAAWPVSINMINSLSEDFLQINTPEYPLRGRNTLISSLRRWHSPHLHILPGSIKFAIRGQVEVETRSGVYRLNNHRILVLNAWEPYTFKIPSNTLTQTFTVFFRPRYLGSLQHSLINDDDALLVRGGNDELPLHLEFPETLLPAESNGLREKLLTLFNCWQTEVSQYCLADRVREIGEALVRLRCGSLSQLSKINAVKRSTREELLRRVQTAAIFIRENLASNIDLHIIARQVGMAPHHLHRTFRSIHGVTPYQWIMALRLEEAKRLLCETELPVSRICDRVGYSSVPSFTRLFASRFGKAPAFFRRSLRID